MRRVAKLGSIIIVGGLFTIHLSLRKPVYLSSPNVGGEWSVFNWIPLLYPIAVTAVLGSVFFVAGNAKKIRVLHISSLGIIIFHSAITFYFAARLYFFWQSNVIGRYFFPPYSSLYTDLLWRFVKPIFGGILAAMIFTGAFYAIRSIGGKHLLGEFDIHVGIFAGLVLGLDRAIIALFLGFVGAAITSVFLQIFGVKRQVRLASPFLLCIWIALFWGKELIQVIMGR